MAGCVCAQINIDLPDLEGRTAIFKVHLKKIKLGHDMEYVMCFL